MKRHFDFLFFFLFFLCTLSGVAGMVQVGLYIYIYRLYRTLYPSHHQCAQKERASAPMWQKEVQP